MNKIALIFLCILLNACTWNGIHISVLPDGNYSIIYESIGIKSDLENEDFVHPSNNNNQWITTIEDNEDNSSTKITINKEPIKGKLIFENKENLSYWIDVQKKESLLRNEYYFSATMYDLRIDEKYPSIVDFLDVEADSISWLLPAKKYIICHIKPTFKRIWVQSRIVICKFTFIFMKYLNQIFRIYIAIL